MHRRSRRKVKRRSSTDFNGCANQLSLEVDRQEGELRHDLEATEELFFLSFTQATRCGHGTGALGNDSETRIVRVDDSKVLTYLEICFRAVITG